MSSASDVINISRGIRFDGVVTFTNSSQISDGTNSQTFGGLASQDSVAAGDVSGLGSLATASSVNLGTQVSGTLGTGNAASGLINSNISISSNGTLSGAGGGQVTRAGIGAIAASEAAAAVNNNSTTINGSKITTGTITASQIASNTITANQISSSYVYAGSLDADNITAGTIDVDYLPGITRVATGGSIDSGVSSTRLNVKRTAVSGSLYTSVTGSLGSQTLYRFNENAVLSGVTSGSTIIGTATVNLQSIGGGSDNSQAINTVHFILDDGSSSVGIPLSSFRSTQEGLVNVGGSGQNQTFSATLVLNNASSGTSRIGSLLIWWW